MFKRYYLEIDQLTKDLVEQNVSQAAKIKINKSPMELIASRFGYIARSALLREHYVDRFGFALVTEELLDEVNSLIKGKRTIEIGCGSGWLAKCYRERYPDENYETLDNGDWLWENRYIELDHTADYATFDYSNYDVVIISWPNYGDSSIEEVLKELPTGCLFLHCGESMRGCTGTDVMFDLLEEKFEHKHHLVNSITFSGLHDTWDLYIKL